jgi:hypothetical protein
MASDMKLEVVTLPVHLAGGRVPGPDPARFPGREWDA